MLRDERGAVCGFMDEPIAAQVSMAHAWDYQLHLPRMGRSPELEHDRPAFVVAFAGPIVLPTFGGIPPLGLVAPAGPRPPSTGVVCVVVNGSPTYYTDVDVAGVH